MRPTLELLDLLDQVWELMRVELLLVRAEISERASGIPSNLTSVVVACGIRTIGNRIVVLGVSQRERESGLSPGDLQKYPKGEFRCAFGNCWTAVPLPLAGPDATESG